MTVVGIAGCIGLLIAGFGFKDSLNEVVKSQYDRLYLFNTKIALDKDKIINDVGEDIAENPQGDLTTCLGWDRQDELDKSLANVLEKVIKES